MRLRKHNARINGYCDTPFASHRTPHLLTILDLLHQHVKGDRTAPIPIALTFGLHAIRHSMYVVQGDGDLARLASFAKKSYNTLFAQLDSISDPTKPSENSPIFYFNVNLFKNLVKFCPARWIRWWLR
jgi:hypothetical protein